MQKLRMQKGITLIALIMTIIVMLILVGVTVSVSLNEGLFEKAKEAAEGTELERDKEIALSGGGVKVDGLIYASMEDYVNKKIKLPENVESLPEEEVKAEGAVTSTWDLTKVTAVEVTEADGTTKNTIPLPKGFQISLEQGENTIKEGLVITDGENEFVWIPIPATASFENPYVLEPRTVTKDTQTDLTTYYGKKADGRNYYTIVASDEYRNNAQNTFAYNAHYAEMVASVEKYDGFYIGRYETTIDGASIGSKQGATVLSADMKIAQTNNKAVRWWGLYDVQRNSNVKGNGNIVQTNMIWGQQWGAMISYFDNATPKIDYEKTTVSKLVTSGKQNAGQAKYTHDSKTISDEIYNIYDLRGNVRDWTAQASSIKPADYRRNRGGSYRNRYSASVDDRNSPSYNGYDDNGSRLALYIK